MYWHVMELIETPPLSQCHLKTVLYIKPLWEGFSQKLLQALPQFANLRLKKEKWEKFMRGTAMPKARKPSLV